LIPSQWPRRQRALPHGLGRCQEENLGPGRPHSVRRTEAGRANFGLSVTPSRLGCTASDRRCALSSRHTSRYPLVPEQTGSDRSASIRTSACDLGAANSDRLVVDASCLGTPQPPSVFGSRSLPHRVRRSPPTTPTCARRVAHVLRRSFNSHGKPDSRTQFVLLGAFFVCSRGSRSRGSANVRQREPRRDEFLRCCD
jgi:hypothetical protein